MKQIGNYHAPETWDDVTIAQLMTLQTMTNGGSLEDTLQAVKVFNPDANLMGGDFSDLIETATEIYKLISQAPNAKTTNAYFIGGEPYKIIDPEELEVGEFMDLNTLNDDESQRIKNLPLIISIITKDRPEDVHAWAEKIRANVSVQAAMGILVFFSDALMRSIVNTPYYSQIMEGAKTKKKKPKG